MKTRAISYSISGDLTLRQADFTAEKQAEADGELAFLGDKRRKGGCGGCLPDFVQRHEYEMVDMKVLNQQLIDERKLYT